MLQLPIEIHNEIVFHFVWDRPIRRPRPKPRWRDIEPLSLVCRAFRRMVLEAWFHTLCICRRQDLSIVSQYWPELPQWVRVFVCLHNLLVDYDDEWDLAPFINLREVVVQMLPFWDVIPFPCLANVPPSVTKLDMTGMGEIGPTDLEAIVKPFPNLRVLRLQPYSTWCGLCNTFTSSSFSCPVPSSLTYEGGVGLPAHFAQFLQPLEDLETLYITAKYDLLSDEEANPLLEIGEENKTMWSGECRDCMQRLYPDDSFREDWVAKKKTPAIHLPALKRVEWIFLSGDAFANETGGKSHFRPNPLHL